MPIYTTLKKIKSFSPCKDGWETLLAYLNKTKCDDEPLLFSTILKSNGLNHALWCLRTVHPEQNETIMKFINFCVERACDNAEKVLPMFEAKYPKDDRPRKAIETARKVIRGEIPANAAYAAANAANAAANAANAAQDKWLTENTKPNFGM